jgi:hypothetical protein
VKISSSFEISFVGLWLKIVADRPKIHQKYSQALYFYQKHFAIFGGGVDFVCHLFFTISI